MNNILLKQIDEHICESKEFRDMIITHENKIINMTDNFDDFKKDIIDYKKSTEIILKEILEKLSDIYTNILKFIIGAIVLIPTILFILERFRK